MKDLFDKINNLINQNNNNHLKIMYDAIIKNKFNKILEFGVDRGTSTAAFLLASEKLNVKVFSIDIKDCSQIIKHKNWNFFQSNDLNKEKIFEKFPELKKGIDFLYIDSYHEPNHIRKLLETYFPYLNNKGHIYVDDTSAYPYRKINSLTNSITSDLSRETVEEFYFSNSNSMEYFFNGNENGLCILIKKSQFSDKINTNKIWKYNFFFYHILKILKKIKYYIKFKSN